MVSSPNPKALASSQRGRLLPTLSPSLIIIHKESSLQNSILIILKSSFPCFKTNISSLLFLLVNCILNFRRCSGDTITKCRKLFETKTSTNEDELSALGIALSWETGYLDSFQQLSPKWSPS
ncbi:hypothetical protein Tco_0935658 [Tanacetum coccineum]